MRMALLIITIRHARRHAVPRYVGDVGRPSSALVVVHDVHQIAANLGARNRHAAKFVGADVPRDGRHQLAVNGTRQRQLCVQLEVAAAFPREEHHEEGEGGSDAERRPQHVGSQPRLEYRGGARIDHQRRSGRQQGWQEHYEDDVDHDDGRHPQQIGESDQRQGHRAATQQQRHQGRAARRRAAEVGDIREKAEGGKQREDSHGKGQPPAPRCGVPELSLIVAGAEVGARPLPRGDLRLHAQPPPGTLQRTCRKLSHGL